MTITTVDSQLLDDWGGWRAERLAAATAPHGIASVTGMHWLDDAPQTILGLPGRWTAADVTWEERRFGEVLVRAIRRDGQTALRVFDPSAVDVTAVDAFDYDPAWVLGAEFRPASDGSTVRTGHVDGRVGDSPLAGAITLADRGVELLALAFPDGRLHVTFADETNGRSTQQFRFLLLDRPSQGERLDVDFNRAFLPPCAFTDHYLCPLPPPQNRLPFPVAAGETFVRR